MRRLRYQVAASLDGYIAGPNGEYDWIVHDSSIDFAAHYPKVTVLRDDVASEVASLKEQPGKDIWLFGGGIPLAAAGRRSPRLHLEKCEPLPSGIVMMSYRTRS